MRKGVMTLTMTYPHKMLEWNMPNLSSAKDKDQILAGKYPFQVKGNE